MLASHTGLQWSRVEKELKEEAPSMVLAGGNGGQLRVGALEVVRTGQILSHSGG